MVGLWLDYVGIIAYLALGPMGFPWGSRRCPPVSNCFFEFFWKIGNVIMLPQWPAGAPGLMGVMGYPGAGAYGAPGPGP